MPSILGAITTPTLPWLTAVLAWRGTRATFWRTAFFEVAHSPVMAHRQTNPDEKVSSTQFFLLPIAEVASLLRTNVETGLSQSAITELQVQYGRNTLKTSGGSKIWLSNMLR
jgi:hypothetical protein